MKLRSYDRLNADNRYRSVYDRNSTANDSECKLVTVDGKINLAFEFKWRVSLAILYIGTSNKCI